MAVLDAALPRAAEVPVAPAGPRALAHVPALDGLRGLAVAGVVAFHLGWIDGGYLGVDAFFVLSGFLITSLLLVEHHRDGSIGLARFWARRSRRLLPAMLVMVAVVLLWAMVADRGQLAEIRGDAVATLLYVANWHEIATSSNYWALFESPSPLQHAWSLAIEEQFYLVWPLVVVVLARWCRHRGRDLAGAVGATALLAAAGSYLLMAWLYDARDVSRAYFGTASRLGAIALGAVLAAVVARRPASAGARSRALDVGGLVALGGLAWAWWAVEGTTPWLYRGGFLMLGLAVVVVLAAALQPGGMLATLASWRPLRALGLISYGLYLWHWVVIAILTPDRTGWSGLSLDVVQLAASFAAALTSFWLLEQPIRHRRALRGPRSAVPAALGAYAAVFGLVAVSTAVPGPDLSGLATTLQERAASPTVPAVAPSKVVASTAVPRPATTMPPTTPATTLAPLPPPRVGIFGDSTAIRTGQGLAQYGQRTGAFEVVVNYGRVGCGVERGGQRRFRDEEFTLADFCGDPAERWAEVVAATPIDVAVVQTGMWETVERRLPGDASWRTVGDPALDAQILADIVAADAFWSQLGVPVVWLRAPTPSYLERAPGTMERFNELLEQAVGLTPAATTVGLDRFLGGLSEGERDLLRPDGIHFTPQTAVLVADTWLGPQLTQAMERVRRAGT